MSHEQDMEMELHMRINELRKCGDHNAANILETALTRAVQHKVRAANDNTALKAVTLSGGVWIPDLKDGHRYVPTREPRPQTPPPLSIVD